MTLVLHRKVHRYVGRRSGGHRLIASSIELSPEEERLLATRTDLAGDDVGVAVPPYLSYSPLVRHGALTWTAYDPGADRTGAVRSETLIFEPLLDPFVLLPFVQGSARASELEDAREREGALALEPLRVEEPAAPPPEKLLEPLAALTEEALVLLLSALEGPLPLAIVSTPRPIEVLRALFALAPRAGRAQQAFCTGALAPRSFARLVAAPDLARERFTARAARERDLALVDLASARAWNVEPTELASRIAAAIRAGGAREVLALVDRASLVAVFTQFADLADEVRYEELTLRATGGSAAVPGPTARTPEESVELANHLRRRGAPREAVLDCYRAVVAAARAQPGRIEWTTNIFLGGYLPLRLEIGGVPDVEEARDVRALVEAACAADLWPGVASFVERAGAVFAAASAAARDAARARAVAPDGLDAASVLALAGLVDASTLATLAVAHPAAPLTDRCVETVARGEPRVVRAFLLALTPSPAKWRRDGPVALDPERTGALVAIKAEPPTGRLEPPTGRLEPPTGRLEPPTGRVETRRGSEQTGAFAAVRLLAPRALELVSLAARELLPRLGTLELVRAHRHALGRIARVGHTTGREDLARLGRARSIELALAAADALSVERRLVRHAERGGFEEAAWVLERWGPVLGGAAPALGAALARHAPQARVEPSVARRVALALPDHAWAGASLHDLLALGERAGSIPRWDERLARAADATVAAGDVDRALLGPRGEAAAFELGRALRRRAEARVAWVHAANHTTSVLARSRPEEAVELGRAAEKLAAGFAVLLERGELDVAELARLSAPALRSALAALGSGFHLKVQNGVEALALRAAGEGAAGRELLLIGLEHLAGLGDKELGGRVAKRIRAAARADDRAVNDLLSALESGKLRRPSAK